MAEFVSEIDLHVHTTASDGTMSPTAVVNYARQKKLRAIAITDHDTMDGLEEGIRQGEIVSLEVISGLELSLDFHKGTMHLLGYFIDPHCPELLEKLEIAQRYRAERNERMLQRLRDLGIDIEFSEVAKLSEDGQIGRPHFARVLVQKGNARDIQDAFARFLRKGGPAYVEKFRFTPDEAIRCIIRAGGLPVLAHPFTLARLDGTALDILVKELKEKGLEGIEVYYPDHTEEQSKLYHQLAQEHGLLITGGTDFHGLDKIGADLGAAFGDTALTYLLVERLKARRAVLFNQGIASPCAVQGEQYGDERL